MFTIDLGVCVLLCFAAHAAYGKYFFCESRWQGTWNTLELLAVLIPLAVQIIELTHGKTVHPSCCQSRLVVGLAPKQNRCVVFQAQGSRLGVPIGRTHWHQHHPTNLA